MDQMTGTAAKAVRSSPAVSQASRQAAEAWERPAQHPDVVRSHREDARKPAGAFRIRRRERKCVRLRRTAL